jgi:hypothetical protein
MKSSLGPGTTPDSHSPMVATGRSRGDRCAPALLGGRLHDPGPMPGATLAALGLKAHHGALTRDRDDARDAELHGLLEGVIHALAARDFLRPKKSPIRDPGLACLTAQEPSSTMSFGESAFVFFTLRPSDDPDARVLST